VDSLFGLSGFGYESEWRSRLGYSIVLYTGMVGLNAVGVLVSCTWVQNTGSVCLAFVRRGTSNKRCVRTGHGCLMNGQGTNREQIGRRYLVGGRRHGLRVYRGSGYTRGYVDGS
jgi:hypothetical protein